jgi:rod shape-determining protein MreC
VKLLFEKKSRIGLRAIFFSLIAVALMLADFHSALLKRFRYSVSLLVSPIQYIVSAPIDWTSDALNALSMQKNLLQENTQLKVQNTLLNASLQQQAAIESENKLLKALLQSSAAAGGHVSEAQILSISLDPSIPQVVINKGKQDGLFLGQSVLDEGGVIGQVIEIGPLTSHVMLLTSPQSAIPVQVSRNGIRSILVGNGANDLLKLLYITSTTDIKPGDQLITSGLAGRFPYGYAAGEVVSVQNDPNDRFSEVLVKPASHLNQSRLVLLVWPPESEEPSS